MISLFMNGIILSSTTNGGFNNFVCLLDVRESVCVCVCAGM